MIDHLQDRCLIWSLTCCCKKNCCVQLKILSPSRCCQFGSGLGLSSAPLGSGDVLFSKSIHAHQVQVQQVCVGSETSSDNKLWINWIASLTVSSRCLAFSPGSRRRPAVAFRTTGVMVHMEDGMLDLATSRSSMIPDVHWTHGRRQTGGQLQRGAL